jgi:hypothetical protein
MLSQNCHRLKLPIRFQLIKILHRVGVDEGKQRLEYHSINVIDHHTLRACLLHVPKELCHEYRGPNGKNVLVRSERPAGHEKRDIHTQPAAQEFSEVLLQAW